MAPAYHCWAPVAPQAVPQGVFSFSLQCRAASRARMPSIAFTVSLAILWCPLRLLSAYSANLCAADGSRHGLHGVYAERRFKQNPPVALASATHPSSSHFLPLLSGRCTPPPPVSARRLGAAYAWRPHMRSNSAMCAHPPIASGALNVLTASLRRGPFQPIFRWSKPQWLRQMRGLVLDFAATATKTKGIGSITKVCGKPPL
jgi:hypothetical protein